MAATGRERSRRWIAIRTAGIAALLAAAFGVVGVRAVQLQVIQAGRLGAMARDQSVRELEWKPRRGTITDRNGVPLAQDVEADSIFVDPEELPARGRRAALVRLARALRIDPRALERRVARGGRFVWAKRRISPDESTAVRALRFSGIGVIQESRRYYPRRELAAQVVGFVGADGGGLEGIERVYDEALSGEATRVDSLRDARGRLLLRDAPDHPVEGERVELTIEQGLQHAAEQALGRAVAQSHAAAGMLVALDPRTGEILALANAPTFNPNTPPRGDGLRDRAVLDSYEPGSTFKIFLMAAALDAGVLHPSDALFCENGSWRVGSSVIHDSHPIGWVGPAQVMAASSNICAAKIGQRLGRKRLQAALESFGFGERTDVGLPGEPRGRVPYPRADVSLATMSFGQGVTATPLQITAAVAAIADGGTLMRPLLVRRVIDPTSGRTLSEPQPFAVRRVASRSAAATVTRWMEGVITDPEGTGKQARLDGWSAAGKTGTAQKADAATGRYSADERFSSFVGFAPAVHPRIVVGVFVDEPKGEVYGGEVAAPVFRAVAEYALRGMGVPPTHPDEVAAEAEPPPEPDLLPRPTVEQALQTAQPRGNRVAVPLLRGLPARSAIKVLEAVELLGDPSGTGLVASQQPPPGTFVARGARVRLALRPPE